MGVDINKSGIHGRRHPSKSANWNTPYILLFITMAHGADKNEPTQHYGVYGVKAKSEAADTQTDVQQAGAVRASRTMFPDVGRRPTKPPSAGLQGANFAGGNTQMVNIVCRTFRPSSP